MVQIPQPAQQGQPVGGVQTRPAGDDFIRVTPADTSAPARDLAAAGGALQQLGQVLQKKRDDNTLRQAEIDYNTWEREQLDPQTGIFTRRQGDAAGVTAAVQQSFDEFRDTQLASTENLSGSGRQALEQFYEGAGQRMWKRAASHELNETQAHEQTLLTSLIEGQVDRAAVLYSDPDEVASATLQVESLAGDLASTLGLKGAARDQFVEGQVSALHAQVAQQMANTGDAVQAEAYIDELLKDGRIDGTDAVSMKASIHPMAVEQQGKALATQELDAMGNTAPAGSRTPSQAAFIQTAEKVFGMNEADQNEAIAQYLADGGVNLDPAVTAWCAGFVNSTLAQMGVEGTDSLWARDFTNWGVATDAPQRGDIVVVERGAAGGTSHVGFFMGFDEAGNPKVLGGNQGRSGAVDVRSYSRDKVLAYRTSAAGSRGEAPAASVISDHPDPEVRAAATAEVERQMALQHKQFNRTQSQLTDALYADMDQAFAANGAYDLNAALAQPGVREALGDKVSSLRTYWATLSKGEQIPTDMDYYRELQVASETGAGNFAAMSLDRSRLSQQDYRKFTDLQAKALGDAQGGSIVGVSDLRANIGPITTGLKPEERGEIERRMFEYVEVFTAQNGKPPSALQQYAQAERLSGEQDAVYRFNQPGFGNFTSTGAANLQEALDKADELGLDSLLGTDLVVEVPMASGDTARVQVTEDDMREAIGQFVGQVGRAPKPSQVIQMLILTRSDLP